MNRSQMKLRKKVHLQTHDRQIQWYANGDKTENANKKDQVKEREEI